MGLLQQLYRPSLALLTDLYEVTMAYGYWKNRVHGRRATFHLFFREAPFDGGYAVACGLETAVDWLRAFRFDDADLATLAALRGNDGNPLFEDGFLDALRDLRPALDVDAVPEGTPVFGSEPLVRVRGPILEAQLVESALLNAINYQTLIATKAARVKHAAGDDPVIEFGLRRAQGVDGAVSAARAAFCGGCDGTSNLLAGRLLGIPVKGTHAHSWVMFFDDEPEAFARYADALPNNCIFLVDTYDSLGGVRRAIRAGRALRERGHEMVGIRLDSGDLAWLSIEARRLLDEAGFPEAKILASNDLDERLIASLKVQGARIGIWGVGTRLVTGHDQPALGGVYKLSAVERDDGTWADRLKLSEQTAKISYPGVLNVRRYRVGDEYAGDLIWDEPTGVPAEVEIVDPLDATRRKRIPQRAAAEDLLRPVFRDGAFVGETPSLDAIRRRTETELARFHPGIKRFDNPHQYPVGLERRLHERRVQGIAEARRAAAAGAAAGEVPEPEAEP